MIEIIEYWNKVIDDPGGPMPTKVIRDEYEIKRRYNMDSDLDELKRRWVKNPRMEIKPDMIVEDMGRYYGIHSYREIRRA